MAPENVTVLLWQVSHAAEVTTWPAGLPGAVEPLWQDAQPDVMPVCENEAPENVTVLLWQVSHAADVATWPAGFPGAVEPLWQDAQPDVMPV